MTNAAMKYASDTVHALVMKFAVYNTMRELSDRCEKRLLGGLCSIKPTFTKTVYTMVEKVEDKRGRFLAGAWS